MAQLAQPVPAAVPQNLGGDYTVLGIIDRAFRVYRANFLAFVSIVAAVTLPFAVLLIPLTIQQQATFDPFSTTTTPTDGMILLLNLVVSLLQVIVVQSILVYLASEAHHGRMATLGEAFRAVRGRFATLGGTYFLLYIIAVGLFLVSILTIQCLVGIVGLAFSIYFIIAIQFMLLPVIVLEAAPPVLGINRAWSLGKQRFWRGMSLGILMALIPFTLTISFAGVAEFGYGPLRDAGQSNLVIILQTLVNNILSVFVAPLSPIAYTIFYYDTRVRLEALDIAYAISDKPDPRPADIDNVKPSGRMFRSQDIANIGLLLLIVLTIVALFAGLTAAFIAPFIDSGAF